MKIVLTGASGLIGSRFFDLLKSKYEITALSSSYGVDITDRKKVESFLDGINPAVIVHLAAKTNVDACEEDKAQDERDLFAEKVLIDKKLDIGKIDSLFWKGSKTAFGINVVGTKNLADFAKLTGAKMIYVSTDFVFDGEKDFYTEEDEVNPINWYGQTKLWGEEMIDNESLITRISFPFGFKSAIKNDLVWTLVNLLSTQEKIKLVSDQSITPTFIDDVINGIDYLIENKKQGLINLTGNNNLSPEDIGRAIAREYGFDEGKIDQISRGELYKGRAKRPFKLWLKNDKLKSLGFEMTDFFEALKRIKL